MEAPAPYRRIEEMGAALWLFPMQRYSRPSGSARLRQRAAGEDLLRSALSAATASRVPRESWRFSSAPSGRPRIAAPSGERLRFSVSYGDGAFAVAVSRRGEIGVDIEPLAPEGLAEIAWSELSPDEQMRLRAMPEHERYGCFVRMWTLKEAFAKCTGRGASAGFSAIETIPDPPGIADVTVPVYQDDVEIGGRRHSLAVCAADASLARREPRQYAARTASAGSAGPMS